MTGFSKDLFAGRRYAVVGLGLAGLAAMRSLTDLGATVVGWDDAPFARDAALREDFLVQDPTPDIGDFTALVLSPGIPHRLPVPHRIAAAAVAGSCPIVTDAELLYQAVRLSGGQARFVGITGTNGKSTTTALLAYILGVAGVPHRAGANLGPAALSLGKLPDDGVYVLEMSSYMLERLATLRFDVACMLNLSPDHIDRHGDMAGYASAKQQIFARQQPTDSAVVGIDDSLSDSLADNLPRSTRISGWQPADVWSDSGVLRDAAGEIADLSQAQALTGAHNAQNAAAAAAMALALGVARDQIRTGLQRFPGLAHRQELVGSVGGIRFINDSKATNADAAARALSCYDRVVWIAGGIAKAGGIETLVPYFSRVAQALLIGRDAEDLAKTLSAHSVPTRIMQTLDDAVTESLASARRLDARVVLLSPACASFDQFSGFEERGAVFASCVRALGAGA